MRIGIVITIAAVLLPAWTRAQNLTVSAAVSLKEAMADVADVYKRETGQIVQFNFGATGHLLAQMRQGAPIDVFIAASDAHMDQAQQEGLIHPQTRREIAGNRIVLIVPADAEAKIRSLADLADPSIKRLAIGEPRTVPAGDYAMQVLRHLKLDSALGERMVQAASVRQVLDYVERGEVDAGIVYATDAKHAGAKVRVVATAEEAWHTPIRYPAAVTTIATPAHGAADAFVEFLASAKAQAILAHHGFTAPLQPTTGTTNPATSVAPAGR